jgi:hypothetical protein
MSFKSFPHQAQKNLCKILACTLILVGNTLALLELIILELVGCHCDDVLLAKDAGLALTLASPAISDGDTIGDAILAIHKTMSPL